MVPRRVLVIGQSQPLLLRRLDRRLCFLGGARAALAVYGRRVRKDPKSHCLRPTPIGIMSQYKMMQLMIGPLIVVCPGASAQVSPCIKAALPTCSLMTCLCIHCPTRSPWHDSETSGAGAAVWPGSTVACMWCVRLGYKNCNRRLQAPLCVHSSPF